MSTAATVIIPCFNEERGIAPLAGESRSVLTCARAGASVSIQPTRRRAECLWKGLANYISSSRSPDLNCGLRDFRWELAVHCVDYAVVYLPIVLLCLVYGDSKMLIDFTQQPNISVPALPAFVSALQILLIGVVGDAIASRLGRLTPGPPSILRWEEMSSPGPDVGG